MTDGMLLTLAAARADPYPAARRASRNLSQGSMPRSYNLGAYDLG